MINGYLDEILAEFPFSEKWDIDEPTLQQVVRDCIGFWYRNRELLRPIWDDPFEFYGERETGRDFYLTRNGGDAFLAHEDIFAIVDTSWTALNSSAVGFGPCQFNSDPDGAIRAVYTNWGWGV